MSKTEKLYVTATEGFVKELNRLAEALRQAEEGKDITFIPMHQEPPQS